MGNKGYQVQPNLLFWVRLKTLESNNKINQILQIAYMYTDMKLSICQSGSHIAIQCNKQVFDNLDSKELKFLKENGLYEACIKSNIGLEEAENLILKDIEIRNIARGQLLAAGKQVHLAKYALMHHMPKLYDFLHYRIFDLDSVSLAVQRFKTNRNQENQQSQQNEQRQQRQQNEVKMSQNDHQLKRAQQEVWQDIHQMQFYFEHALNDN